LAAEGWWKGARIVGMREWDVLQAALAAYDAAKGE
jgi:hypothetical protein